MIEKIEDIIDNVLHFFRKIIHIFYWLPVIWNNQWWDYNYLLQMMLHQIRYMEKNWDNSIYIGKEKDKKNITTARILLDRITKDDYVYMYHNFEPDDNDPLGMKIIKRGFYIEENKNCCGKEIKQKYRDIKFLFDHLTKNIQKWWD